jgi:hypothetical protein
MSAVAADCDALTFLLVHHKLTSPLQALLGDCGWTIVTLDAIYQREAIDQLRRELDVLIKRNLCTLAPHPEADSSLAKDERKLWLKIDQFAQKHFARTSKNDRGILFVAEQADIVLVSEDGPLKALAQARDKTTLDVLDVLAILSARGSLSEREFAALLEKEAKRRSTKDNELRDAIARRGHDHWPCVAAQADATSGEPEG